MNPIYQRIRLYCSLPQTWLLIALMLLTFGLRTYKLGQTSLWLDEAFGYQQISQPLSTIITKPVCCHPPLNFMLVHGWRAIFGESETALRFPSALFATLAGFGLYWLGQRWFGQRVGLLTLGLFAVSSRLVYHAREVTPYGLVLFMAVALIGLADAIWRAPSWRRYLGFGVLSLLSLMSHYGLAIFLASLTAAFATRWLVDSHAVPGQRRVLLLRLVKLTLCQMPGWMLFAFFYLRFTRQQAGLAQAKYSDFAGSATHFLDQTYKFIQFIVLENNSLRLASIALSLFFVIGTINVFQRREFAWLGMLLAVSLITSYILTSRAMFFYAGRHILFAAPSVLLLIGLGLNATITQLSRLKAGAFVGAVGVLVLFGAIVTQLPLDFMSGSSITAEQEDLNVALECVAQQYQPGDAMYVYYGAQLAFNYYNQRYRWPAVQSPWMRAESAEAQIAAAEEVLHSGRGWLIFTHVYGQEQDVLVNALQTHADRLAECQAVRALAVLFDVRPRPAP